MALETAFLFIYIAVEFRNTCDYGVDKLPRVNVRDEVHKAEGNFVIPIAGLSDFLRGE